MISPCLANTQIQARVQGIADQTGVEAGVGWSSNRAAPTFQNCVMGRERLVASPVAETHARRVESMESLYKDQQITITARAKAKFGGGGGSATASYRKFESSLSTTNSLKLSLVSTREVGWSKLDPVDESGAAASQFRLTNEHKALLGQGEQAFRDACGDYFVVAIRKKSVATGLVSIALANNEMKRAVEKSLGLSASYGTASVSGTIKSIENTIINKQKLQNSVDFATVGFKPFEGDKAPLNSPDTLEEVTKFFDSIESSVLEPVVYQVTLMPYQATLECSSGQCPKPLDSPAIDNEALYYERLDALLRELRFVRLDADPLVLPADKAYMGEFHRLVTDGRGAKLLDALQAEHLAAERDTRMALAGQGCGNPGMASCPEELPDDLRFSIAIPVASSAVPAALKDSLRAAVTDRSKVDELRYAYAYLLWWDRVERISADRCGGEDCADTNKRSICQVLELTGAMTEGSCNPATVDWKSAARTRSNLARVIKAMRMR